MVDLDQLESLACKEYRTLLTVWNPLLLWDDQESGDFTLMVLTSGLLPYGETLNNWHVTDDFRLLLGLALLGETVPPMGFLEGVSCLFDSIDLSTYLSSYFQYRGVCWK